MSQGQVSSVLTIAGSDSGGGAGIQADLRTFAAHGLHGLSAITALTAQNTRGVDAVHVPDPAFLRAQLDACFGDFEINAVKLGMLATAEIIEVVADALAHWRPRAVVVDPVMVATSGAKLLADDALDALRRRLLPLATVLTPNMPEAEILLGRPVLPGPDPAGDGTGGGVGEEVAQGEGRREHDPRHGEPGERAGAEVPDDRGVGQHVQRLGHERSERRHGQGGDGPVEVGTPPHGRTVPAVRFRG